LYFANFHTKLSQNTHLFCVIFLDAATNTQQSTKKEGDIKAIGGELLFFLLSTINSKNWSTEEENYFFTNKEDHGSCLDGTALNITTINQQAL
jgi:hypothetical protein